MGENSSIEWTDDTWSPWWGCTKVSEACRNCYAATFSNRLGYSEKSTKGVSLWGPKGRRRFFGAKHWEKPRKWNRAAEKAGERRRVFCASMADLFEVLPDGHPDAGAMDVAREDLGTLIGETPWLDWLLLTKRPENTRRFMRRIPSNVWLGTTVEDQATANERIPYLLSAGAAITFVSCEPLLESVNLTALAGEVCAGCGERIRYDAFAADASCPCCTECAEPVAWSRLSWVIAGGESGHGARPMHPDWARSLRDQCEAVGVPFLFKQFGAWAPVYGAEARGFGDKVNWLDDETGMVRLGKKAAGRLLDGRTWDGVPTL